MSSKNYMPLDQALTPMQMECGNCKSKMTVYPTPLPKGTGVCPKCSPPWLGSFALFQTNQERIRRGLKEVAT